MPSILWCSRDSIKGVKALIASGSLEKSPEAIAAFLRKHIGDLDKKQLGEYLGHHDEQEVRLPPPASQTQPATRKQR